MAFTNEKGAFDSGVQSDASEPLDAVDEDLIDATRRAKLKSVVLLPLQANTDKD